MACYMQDICQYPNCGKRFDNLHDLIIHVEAMHIDFDEAKCSEPGSYNGFTTVPMSYVLKYSSDDDILNAKQAAAAETVTFYESAEQEEEELPGSSYNQFQLNPTRPQWIEPEINSTPININNRKREREITTRQETQEPPEKQEIKTKKYVCPVAGCPKSYKNQNGMKYHINNYHELNTNITKSNKKEHKCQFCDKTYKTFRGLQAHISIHSEGPGNFHYVKQHGNLKLQPANTPANISHLPPITSPQLQVQNSKSFYTRPPNVTPPGYYIDDNATSCYPNPNYKSRNPNSSFEQRNPNPNFEQRNPNPNFEQRNPSPYIEKPPTPRMMMQQSSSNVLHKRIYDQPQQQAANVYKEYYSLGSNPAGTQKWPQYEGSEYNNNHFTPSQNAFVRPPIGFRQFITENETITQNRYNEQMTLEQMQFQERNPQNYGIYNHVHENVNNMYDLNGNIEGLHNRNMMHNLNMRNEELVSYNNIYEKSIINQNTEMKLEINETVITEYN